MTTPAQLERIDNELTALQVKLATMERDVYIVVDELTKPSNGALSRRWAGEIMIQNQPTTKVANDG